MSSEGRFEGKVAIVTASNCGIDQATAVLLGSEGAKVTIHGTEEAELRTTVHLLVHAGVPGENIYVVQGAIDKEETLHNLIDRTVAKFGQIDVLVNNTGGIPQQTLDALNKAHAVNNGSTSSGKNHLHLPDRPGGDSEALNAAMADFDYMFNINLKSITTLTRLAIPHLAESKGGAIVNVSCFGAQKAVRLIIAVIEVYY